MAGTSEGAVSWDILMWPPRYLRRPLGMAAGFQKCTFYETGGSCCASCALGSHTDPQLPPPVLDTRACRGAGRGPSGCSSCCRESQGSEMGDLGRTGSVTISGMTLTGSEAERKAGGLGSQTGSGSLDKPAIQVDLITEGLSWGGGGTGVEEGTLSTCFRCFSRFPSLACLLGCCPSVQRWRAHLSAGSLTLLLEDSCDSNISCGFPRLDVTLEAVPSQSFGLGYLRSLLSYDPYMTSWVTAKTQ